MPSRAPRKVVYAIAPSAFSAFEEVRFGRKFPSEDKFCAYFSRMGRGPVTRFVVSKKQIEHFKRSGKINITNGMIDRAHGFYGETICGSGPTAFSGTRSRKRTR